MTIPANIQASVTYIGNSTSFQFPFAFRMLNAADIKVTVFDALFVGTVLAQTIQYTTVFKNFPLLGGTVTLVDGGQAYLQAGKLKTGYSILIEYVVNVSQGSNFKDYGPRAPLYMEQAFDKSAMDLAGILDRLNRTVSIPGGGGAVAPELPPLIGNANKGLYVNATEDGYTYGPTVLTIETWKDEAEAAALSASLSLSAVTSQAVAAALSASQSAASAIVSAGYNANASAHAIDAENSAIAAAVSASDAEDFASLAHVHELAAADSALDAEILVKLTFYTAIVDLTFANSPYTITLADDGKLFRVDTSGGIVIMNLPTRPAVSPDYRVSIVKTDGSANAIQINPYGADTVGGAAFQLMLLQFYGYTFTPGVFSDWQERIFTIGTSNSGLPSIVTEPLVGIVDGVNTLFSISQLSLTQSLIIFKDGLRMEASEYVLVGTNISFAVAPELGQAQPFAWYFVTSVTTSGVKGKEATPIGVIDGINGVGNLDFDLLEIPYNKASMMIFINGRYTDAGTWTLLQTVTGSRISFTAGNAPELGSSLVVFYLVNLLQAVSLTPPPASTGSLVVHGNRLAPVILTAAGLTVLDERRAIYYIKSNGGQVFMPGIQISAGFQVGDELIIVGVDPVDYLSFVDGQGCEFNGNFDLKAGPPGPGVFTTKKYLIFDGVVWSETPMI